MHKTVYLTPNSPYCTTTVPFGKSKEQIKEMLQKFGADQILDYQKNQGDEIIHSIAFSHRGTNYRIDFPVTYLKKVNSTTLNMKISGRIIFNRIKALLIDAEIDYLSFTQAMSPFLLVRGNSGGLIPLEESIEENKDVIQSQVFGLIDCLQLPAPYQTEKNIDN